ncbi:MAG: glutamine--tRNA ligase/YqeY domain fusion protein [Planctomycetota bacterium]
MANESNEPAPDTAKDFIRERIQQDLADGKVQSIVTRFPPEPNGYLHIGHAKAITLSFSVAQEFGGRCNLRMDDTTPDKEAPESVDAIQEDVRWLGFGWDGELRFASDYFGQLYDWAQKLIREGKAYVDDQTAEDIAANRGTVRTPGTNSPHRERSVDDNLDLFARMKAGEFADGSKVLRAKIDMAHDNLNLRDPVMYRVRNLHHQRTGDEWCIYPMYDWAHGQSDSIEGVTHSLCTLEFEDHRPLYDWYVQALGIHHPQQIEFARLNVEYMLTSKRKLLRLVEDGHVDGWDDPRMPTIRGLRRRGVPPEALVAFCREVGVAKVNGTHELALLDYFTRDWLNKHAPRYSAVLDPVKLVIENWPEGHVEWRELENNPEDETAGTRKVPCTGELYIQRDDFMEDPPKKFFRLGPDREVRLRFGYVVKCTGYDKDADGNVTEIRCTYDKDTANGKPPEGRKVKGVIHWVSAEHAVAADVHLLEPLFTDPDPAKADDEAFAAMLRPDSRKIVQAMCEPGLGEAEGGQSFQFVRVGYFYCDPQNSQAGRPVFHRTVTLKDAWKKAQKRG